MPSSSAPHGSSTCTSSATCASSSGSASIAACTNSRFGRPPFGGLRAGGGRALAHVLGKGVEADHEQLRVHGREVIGEPAVTGPDVDGRARVPGAAARRSRRGRAPPSGPCRPPASTSSAQRCSRPSASTRSYAWLRPIPGITRNACATRRRGHTLFEQRTQQVVELPVGRGRAGRAGRSRPQAARSRACTRRAPSRRRSRSRAPPPPPYRNSSNVFVTSRPRHTRHSGRTAAMSARVSASRGAASWMTTAQPERGELLHGLPARGRAAGQEAAEHEPIHRKARRREHGERGRRPRHRAHGDALRHRPAHDHVAGIAEQRRARVAHERDPGAAAATARARRRRAAASL